MKIENIHNKILQIAKTYLNIYSFYNKHELTSVSVGSVEKALKTAFLQGERLGYEHGFNDAKEACECSLEEDKNLLEVV